MKKKKFKIRKSVAKRFKVTKNGKVLFRGSHVRHLKRKKKRGQLRAQRVPQKLSGKMEKKVKKILGQA
ncbi:50S ribosomal protein L35 [Candidatus Shapirobacteria bacterium]|nr:50S ribosomal protein L35 [Candidatus Shapirobacteria bacterium]